MGGKPVDVISVCRTDGSIEPLRFQVPGSQQQMVRVDVDEIVGRREILHVGVEARIFLCRGTKQENGKSAGPSSLHFHEG